MGRRAPGEDHTDCRQLRQHRRLRAIGRPARCPCSTGPTLDERDVRLLSPVTREPAVRLSGRELPPAHDRVRHGSRREDLQHDLHEGVELHRPGRSAGDPAAPRAVPRLRDRAGLVLRRDITAPSESRTRASTSSLRVPSSSTTTRRATSRSRRCSSTRARASARSVRWGRTCVCSTRAISSLLKNLDSTHGQWSSSPARQHLEPDLLAERDAHGAFGRARPLRWRPDRDRDAGGVRALRPIAREEAERCFAGEATVADFIKMQAKRPHYLKPGDVVEARIASRGWAHRPRHQRNAVARTRHDVTKAPFARARSTCSSSDTVPSAQRCRLARSLRRRARWSSTRRRHLLKRRARSRSTTKHCVSCSWPASRTTLSRRSPSRTCGCTARTSASSRRIDTAGTIDGHPKLVTFYQPDLERALRKQAAAQPSVTARTGCDDRLRRQRRRRARSRDRGDA